MRKIKSLSMQLKLGVLLFGLLGLITNSHAALMNLGNGLVNDDTLNITWLQDANQVKTSCDADNALWQAFDPITVVPNSGRTKAQICAANGELTWFEAEAWIAVLNVQSYLGHNDWRQPATAQPDATCSNQVPGFPPGTPALGTGYNCSNQGSELNHLFYTSLGNPNDLDDGCFGTAPHCFQTTSPFSNTQPSAYWSFTDGPLPNFAWNFHAGTGSQVFGFKHSALSNFHLFVWPVRSGLSPVPPAIPTLSIWGLGVMSLLLAFVARRRV